MLGPEILVATASLAVSVVGGSFGGLAAIFKLSRKLDNRFDKTDLNIRDLVHKYDVQRAKDLSRLEMLEYKLLQHGEMSDHKHKRLENAIWQLYSYLEKNHGYQPRSVFPLERDD